MHQQFKRILREKECKAVTGLPTSTRYDMIGRGEFPKPIPLGRRAVGWDSDEIQDWIASRIDARDSSTSSQTQ